MKIEASLTPARIQKALDAYAALEKPTEEQTALATYLEGFLETGLPYAGEFNIGIEGNYEDLTDEEAVQAVNFLTEKWGGKVALHFLLGHVKFSIQGGIRDRLERGEGQEQIDAFLEGWEPGKQVRKSKKSAQATIFDEVSAIDDEAAKQAKIDELQAMVDRLKAGTDAS